MIKCDRPFTLAAMSVGLDVRSCVESLLYNSIDDMYGVRTFFRRFVVSINTSVSGPKD